jgi:hypothetical protein
MYNYKLNLVMLVPVRTDCPSAPSSYYGKTKSKGYFEVLYMSRTLFFNGQERHERQQKDILDATRLELRRALERLSWSASSSVELLCSGSYVVGVLAIRPRVLVV